MPIYDLLNPSAYATKELTKKRRRICDSCPLRLREYKNNPLSKLDLCPECKCVIHLKTMIQREYCPFHDW